MESILGQTGAIILSRLSLFFTLLHFHERAKEIARSQLLHRDERRRQYNAEPPSPRSL